MTKLTEYLESVHKMNRHWYRVSGLVGEQGSEPFHPVLIEATCSATAKLEAAFRVGGYWTEDTVAERVTGEVTRMANEMIEEEGVVFEVSSGFGYNTQMPYVQVLIPKADWMTQMSPADARQVAFNLLACADAAESDGFLVGFLRTTVGVEDMRTIATVLVQFREYREQQRAGNRD